LPISIEGQAFQRDSGAATGATNRRRAKLDHGSQGGSLNV
jgi:hypothetical protein